MQTPNQIQTMIISSLISVVIGGILGIIFKSFVKKVLMKILKMATVNYSLRYSDEKLYNGIINYYTKKHHSDDLYFCEINGYGERIPFITKQDWTELNYDNMKYNCVKYLNSSYSFTINNKIIKIRMWLGQNLFNGQTLYIDKVDKDHNGMYFFNVLKCNYFEMLTLLDKIEGETNKIKFDKKKKIRVQILSCANEAIKINKRPISIGCQVAFVLNVEDKPTIIIQHRSKKTITFNDSFALLPVFGMSPPLNGDTQQNVLLYDFILEYLEEMYNYPDLDDLRKGKKINPIWFYDLPEAKNMLDMLKKQEAFFELLGFGFDAYNGSLTLANLLLVKSKQKSKAIIDKINCNWEISDSNPIELIPIDDSKLVQYLKEKKYHYGSAFTLSLALKRIKNTYSVYK